MSLIRRNDEHWKDNLIGLSFNKQLEAAIMQRHNTELAIERLETRHSDYKKTGLFVNQNISDAAFVAATTPEGEITDIGFNCPNDLILNNFGVWLAGVVFPPTVLGNTTGYNTCALIDTSNTSRTVAIYRQTSSLIYNTFSGTYSTTAGVNIGSYIQLGSGSTAAARADYAIETALGTAPESGLFGTNAGSYAAGAISFSGAVSAGGAGTVNEMGWFCKWYYGADMGTFMLFHDILGAGVAYVAGQTLNASYAITL